jgi:hypothetical protein
MRRSILALLILALLFPACATADQSNDYVGTYNLVTIDGRPLPYTPPHAGGAPEVLSSTLTLNADGSFQMSMTYRTTPGNSISRDFTGTYTLKEGTFRFKWEGAGVTPGALDSNTVTINNEGVSFAYEK